MSNNKKRIRANVNDVVFYGNLGDKPVAKKGQTGSYTTLSVYDFRLPDSANPVIVTIFDEGDEKVSQICKNFDKGQFVKVGCRQVSYGEISNEKEGTSRIGLCAIGTHCEVYDKDDKKTPDKLSKSDESEVTTQQMSSETNSSNNQAMVETAVAVLKQNGLSVSAASE